MKILFQILLLFFFHALYSQGSYKYWISFTDKQHNLYSTGKPGEYLSERSLERRIKQNIAIDEYDLPVTQCYIDSIRKAGFTVYNVSKWLNGISIADTQAVDTLTLRSFSFVKDIRLVATPKTKTAKKDSSSGTKTMIVCSLPTYYGQSQKQIEIMNGHCLHQMGFRGQGMLIAVMDAGFFQVDSFRAFDSINLNGQVLAMRDFVKPGRDFFNTHSHGMSVLSVIAGNVPDTLIGTAPKADLALIVTEDGDSEYPIEEYNWASGAEYADSIGADIINSSLGYSTFDDASFNHSFSDMNGNTSACAKAANIAGSKGMLVVVSAGNEGSKPWRKIVTPADCRNCLTLGAVDSLRRQAFFSSTGPSADGRIKPDISTMGEKTFAQSWNGSYSRGNGTSYSAPLAAGMAACLWQAFPERSCTDIMSAIRSSASHTATPNDSTGYGIPDFDFAYTILNNSRPSYYQHGSIELSPNPFRQSLHIQFSALIDDAFTIEFFDMKGSCVYSRRVEPIHAGFYDLPDAAALPGGMLVCKLTIGHSVFTYKILKM